MPFHGGGLLNVMHVYMAAALGSRIAVTPDSNLRLIWTYAKCRCEIHVS